MSKKLFLCFVLFNGIVLVAGEGTHTTKRKAATEIEVAFDRVFDRRPFSECAAREKPLDYKEFAKAVYGIYHHSDFETGLNAFCRGGIERIHSDISKKGLCQICAASQQEMRLKRLRKQLS